MSATPLLQDQEGALCRVCHCGYCEEQGILLSPCLCRGSVQWVHRSCLDAWRGKGSRPANRATRCELCRFLYKYELRQSTFGEAALDLLLHGFGAVFPLAAVACLLSSATSVHVAFLGMGMVLGMWAISDVVQSACRRSMGAGVLATALCHLQVAIRAHATTKALARAQAEALAQAHATAEAEAAAEVATLVADTARLEAAAAQARQDAGLPPIARQVMGADAGPGEDVTGLSDEESNGASLFYSMACCVQTAFFLATPPLVSAAWWILHYLLGGSGMHLLAELLAGLGFGYWLLVALLFLIAAAFFPPLHAVCAASGFPVVRSLREAERDRFAMRRF